MNLFTCELPHSLGGSSDLVCLPDRHQLQCPGQYSPLEAFYEDKRAVLPPAGNGPACPTWSVANINRCMHAEMKVRRMRLDPP